MPIKICPKCLKPFKAKSGQQDYCHNPCYPESEKTYNHCSECGRKLINGIWSRIPEKERICSFCIERQQKIKVTQKYDARKKTLRKCSKCGEYCYLVVKETVCRACFRKKENPRIVSMKEVKEEVLTDVH